MLDTITDTKVDDQIEAFRFKSFGIGIEIKTNRKDFLQKVYKRLEVVFLNNIEFKRNINIDHDFLIEFTEKDSFTVIRDGEVLTNGIVGEGLLNGLESQIRLTVAEFAVSKVFLHAGVVSFNNKAIIIPGNSYSGKTTLVKELIKIGAIYFSDEYAILDENGLVHPFPKKLSVRGIIDDYQQLDCSAESFGGKIGIEPVPVRMVLITKYEANAVWEPKLMEKGSGVFEIIPHTLPIRENPAFSLKVLQKASSNAIICKSFRGEANEFAPKILEFFEANA